MRPQLGGLVLRTTDGGRTFRPQVVEPLTVMDIASPGGGTDYLLGALNSQGPPASALLSSATGGDQGRVSTLTLRPRRSSRRPRRGRRPRTVTVQVDGTLTLPEGGERITVSMRPAGRGAARTQTVTAASNGRFTTSWRIRGRTLFVARFSGDDDRRGAGSRVLSVTPR